MEKFITLKVSETTWNLIKSAKSEYKHYHPEFEQVFISNNKIIYEALKYYVES